jgi:hypothetical protein
MCTIKMIVYYILENTPYYYFLEKIIIYFHHYAILKIHVALSQLVITVVRSERIKLEIKRLPTSRKGRESGTTSFEEEDGAACRRDARVCHGERTR